MTTTRTFDFTLSRPKLRPYINVAFDTETCLISPCVQAPNVVALGFRVDGGAVHVVMANDSAFDRVVAELFSDPAVRLYAHNARYDLAVLMAHWARMGRAVEGAQMVLGALHDDRVECTLIREALIRIALAHPMESSYGRWDLGTVCKKWKTPTQPNKLDPYRARWGTLAHLHTRDLPADARRYLDEDVKAVDEVYRAQESKRPWLKDSMRQTRASMALQLMSCWGFATDPEAATALYVKTQAELEEAAAVCREYGLVREDGSREKKATEARMLEVCAAKGIAVPRGEPTEKMRAAAAKAAYEAAMKAFGDREVAEDAAQQSAEQCLGNVKLDEEACEKTEDPILIAYSKVSQAGTLLAKAARLLHPVIQASYVTLMNTGRTSCRQGDDPSPGQAPTAYGSQMQNPPRAEGVRECFVARPGRVLLDIDYAAMEMRTLAQVEMWLFGTSTLGEILNDPKRCPHVELGAKILGLIVEEAYALKKKDPKKFKEMRNLAKGPNFGLPGGMGWERLIDYCWQGYGVPITEELSKKICKLVKEIYPERQRYLDVAAENVRAAKGGRARITCFYSERVRGGVGFCDGANNPFQALAADCGKEALWRLCVHYYAMPESTLYGCRGLAFIHDQTLVEAPEGRFRECAAALQDVWCGAAQDICPDILILAETAVCRRWSKNHGDPVFMPDGQLAIYEDWKAAQKAA